MIVRVRSDKLSMLIETHSKLGPAICSAEAPFGLRGTRSDGFGAAIAKT